MDTLNLAFLAWGMASALGVMALGVSSLRGGLSRPRGALAFGLFAATWAAQIAFGNAASVVASEPLAGLLYLLFVVCALPSPFFLVEFALAQSPAFARPRTASVLRVAAVLTAATGALLLVVAPHLLFQGTVPYDGRVLPAWGAWFVPLVNVPHFAAFAIAIAALAAARRSAPTPRIGRQASWMLAGLGLYAGFTAMNNLAFFAANGTVDPLLATVLAALAATIGWTAWSVGRAGGRVAGADRRLATLLAIPLAWGAVEGLVAHVWFPLLNSVGLWRLAGVGIIAYGLARLRTYDLPQRVSTTAANTGGAVAAFAGGATAYGVASIAFPAPLVPALAGIVVAGASLLPSIRFIKRFVQREESPDDAADRLYGQRIDTYRAALEAALARGTLAEDEGFLAALRDRFGIAPEEDRVLRYYAKSSVLVPRDGATGAYERLRLLGEGGGGRTWLARDRARDRLVVLKEPLERWQREPSLKDAVLREARLAARVRHPNVVTIEEIIEQDGFPVIVMEYLDGGTLADLLSTRGTLPWKDASTLMIEVLRGVEAVHGAGIVHRDVKPSNILLASDGAPKIGDFGVALVPNSRKTVVDVSGPYGPAAPVSAPEGDTLNTVRAGTPVYMAPEVRAGATLGDRRADVYACAAVLHECLYGSPPSPGAALVARSDVPAALASIVLRGLSAKPDQRFPTARAFAEELSRVARP